MSERKEDNVFQRRLGHEEQGEKATEHWASAPGQELTTTILDSVADGVFTVDADWRVTSFNRAAEEITGLKRADALGKPCREVFRADICENRCALRETAQTGQPVVNRATKILTDDDQEVPISISTALLRDAEGQVIGGVETFRDLSLVEDLRRRLDGRVQCGDVITRSHKMREVLANLPRIAEAECTVLIGGESGTGKELIARAIHALSPRSEGPFIAVNCGALPDSLLETELFGHVGGAFTGANRDRAGRFRQADQGTIFLDEIGDVSPAVQVHLLRVLQEREFEPVGTSLPVKVDVRVVCATNSKLAELVKTGAFREDLYYRINVVGIEVPPLRARKEDIPVLVEHFVAHLNKLRDRDVVGVSNEALSQLLAHDWPGNVRELENAIEHGFAICRGDLIDSNCLPVQLRADSSTLSQEGSTLEEIEERAICQALKRSRGKKTAAARELGINKTTLWRKMKRLGIE
jgi:PAS domain S-box-containing protein